MALRASSLQSTNTLAINREIGSQYDVILEVSKHLVEIDTLANEDINGLINSLNEAKDFTGITVVTGETPSWDAVNKVLTVTTEKGDTGADGRGIVDIELTSTVGLTKTYTINYTDATSSTFTVINGANGANGVAGKSVYQLWLDAGNVGTLNDFLEAMKGPKGSTGPQGIGIQGPAGIDGRDLTVEQISYDGNGVFTWQFSDGTSYTTPDLRGPQGITGAKGDKGDQGVSVHHIKGTSTTDLEGDFASYGEIDTYTLYGDAAETINLGYFRVNNGLAKEGQAGIMFRSTYDTNGNGIVDNSERLEGKVAAEFVNIEDSQDIGGTKTFTGDVVIQGNLTIQGTETVVDSVSLGNGVLTWNPDEGTLDIDTGTGVIIQAGQENNRVVRNGTGSTIVNGTVVMVTGTIGNSGRLVVAPASGVAGIAMRVYGVATQDILAGQDGYITIDGKVRGLNTTGSTVGEVWVDGDVLYVKPNDAGNLTKVVPTYGQLKMPVANVIHAHTNGTLEVRVTPIDENAYEPSNSNIQGHIIDTSNPHGVTKAQVGLGNVDNTADVDKPVSTATQAVLHSVNLLRADKYLAAQDVANMEYNAVNKPTKVQYNSSTDTDYEVFTYNENNKLINVAHYVKGILKGNTVLSYSSGKLVSAPFIAV